MKGSAGIDHDWYHGAITREAAELRVRYEPQGTFLVRKSASTNGHCITVGVGAEVMHFLIAQTESEQYRVVGRSEIFSSIAQLVRFFRMNSTDESTGGVTLRYPCLNPEPRESTTDVDGEEYVDMMSVASEQSGGEQQVSSGRERHKACGAPLPPAPQPRPVRVPLNDNIEVLGRAPPRGRRRWSGWSIDSSASKCSSGRSVRSHTPTRRRRSSSNDRRLFHTFGVQPEPSIAEEEINATTEAPVRRPRSAPPRRRATPIVMPVTFEPNDHPGMGSPTFSKDGQTTPHRTGFTSIPGYASSVLMAGMLETVLEPRSPLEERSAPPSPRSPLINAHDDMVGFSPFTSVTGLADMHPGYTDDAAVFDGSELHGGAVSRPVHRAMPSDQGGTLDAIAPAISTNRHTGMHRGALPDRPRRKRSSLGFVSVMATRTEADMSPERVSPHETNDRHVPAYRGPKIAETAPFDLQAGCADGAMAQQAMISAASPARPANEGRTFCGFSSALAASGSGGGGDFVSFGSVGHRRASGFVSSTASNCGSHAGYTDQRVLEAALAAELRGNGVVFSAAFESPSCSGYTDQRVLEAALAAKHKGNSNLEAGRELVAPSRPPADNGGDYATVEYAPQAVSEPPSASKAQENLCLEETACEQRRIIRRTVDL